MKQLYFLLLGIGWCITLKSQIIFEKTLGNASCYEEAFSAAASNGKIVVSGNYNCNFGPGNFKSKMWALDENGAVSDSVENAKISGFMVADNSNFIFAGGNKAGLVYDTIVISKADNTLAQLWQKKYTLGVCNNVLYDVHTVNDGYLFTGFYSTQNCAVAQYDAFVLKLDKQGNEQWLTPVKGNGNQQFYVVKQYDNEIAAFGWTDNTPNGVSKYFITTFNLNGDSINSFYIDTTGAFKGYGMDITSDGFIVNGTKDNNEVIAMKLDKQGNIIWQNKLGDACGSSYYKAYYTKDEQYLFSYINSGNLGCNTTLVKTDVFGNIFWDKTFNATLRSINEIDVGSFLLSGFKLRSGNFISDAYVAKFDTTYMTVGTQPELDLVYSLYPNPANNYLHVCLQKSELYEISITDIAGNTIAIFSTTEKENNINIEALSKGLYFLAIKNKSIKKIHKFIKN